MTASTAINPERSNLESSLSFNLDAYNGDSGLKMKQTMRQVLLRDPDADSPATSPTAHIAKEAAAPPEVDPVLEAVKELSIDQTAAVRNEPPRESYVTARVSMATTAAGSIKNVGDEHGGSAEESTSSSNVSDESALPSGLPGTGGGGVSKPHMANDSRWEAIRAVRDRDRVAIGLNHFRLLKRLGCGDIGSVYLAELGGTRAYFAMKVMDKEALEARTKLARAQTEREILQCLDHPFLPTLYTHFETEKFSCLVMEYCPGGDLHTLRQRQPGKYFPEHAARFYVAEVLLVLEYLHMLGIIYRDLKPENVLVREEGHIMLSDFDLSLRCAVSPTLVRSSRHPANQLDASKSSGYICVEPSACVAPACIQPSCFAQPRFLASIRSRDSSRKTSSNTKSVRSNGDACNQSVPLPELLAEPTSARSMSFVGTHEYLAPEIIKGEGHGSAVDWWTFGIFLYELLFGKTPFKGQGNRATLFNVVGKPLTFPEVPSVSFAARDLITGLLVKEPQQRLAYRRGATEVKQHPFFQSVNWALIRCASPPEIPRAHRNNGEQFVDFAGVTPGGDGGAVDVKAAGGYLDMDFF